MLPPSVDREPVVRASIEEADLGEQGDEASGFSVPCCGLLDLLDREPRESPLRTVHCGEDPKVKEGP
jgi:hypothetical protein